MWWLERLRRLSHPSVRLVDCQCCGSAFVNPVEWEEMDETGWWIRLRCGECGIVREVEVSDEQAARFEQDLDRGVSVIAAAVGRLERSA